MFIDYLPLLLINMVAGLVLLAGYVFFGMTDPKQVRWAPGFIATGVVALVFGGIIATTWPLPGPYNMLFGESSVLFGIIFLAAGLTLAFGGELITVAVYAFFAGLAALVMGVRILLLHLTQFPPLTALGFVATGMGGILAAPGLLWCKNIKPLRVLVGLMLLGAAGIWALNGYGGYWMHAIAFKDWKPATMTMKAPAAETPPAAPKPADIHR